MTISNLGTFDLRSRENYELRTNPPPEFDITYATRAVLALVFLVSLLVSACGGGGGSTASTTASIEELLTADAPQASSTAKSVSNSRPNINSGSVTQSSNYGGASSTATDTVSTSSDGSNVRVTITRQNANSLTFNSATDTYRSTSNEGPTIPGFRFKGHELIVDTNNSLSGADVLVAWANSDTTNYLAAGYWLHIAGNWRNGQVTGIEVGAFVDGPELVGRPSLPNVGSATYRGQAAGLYGIRFGSYIPDLQGIVTLGDYVAPISLTVDFANQTISGCIGCVGVIQLEGFTVSPNGEYETYSVSIDSRLRLGAANINSNGTFTAGNLTWEDELPAGLTIVSTTGNWGGKFSTIQDGTGVPRLVAGTNSAYTKYSDGSEEELVGAFVAAKQ